MKRSTNICIIDGKNNKTLMAWQQRKVVGLKGFGGVIEEGEDPRVSACREVLEETGGVAEKCINHKQHGGIIILPENLEPIALIDFYNGTEEEVPFGNPNFRVLCYRTFVWSGTPFPTIEMFNPDWYNIFNLPFEDMIVGDSLFIPSVILGTPIRGYIRRTSDWKKVIDHDINPCTLSDLVI